MCVKTIVNSFAFLHYYLPLVQGFATVRIITSDINDNAPVFDQPSYYGMIAEGLPIGSTVVMVSNSTKVMAYFISCDMFLLILTVSVMFKH